MTKFVQVIKSEESYEDCEWYEVSDFNLETIKALPFYYENYFKNNFYCFIMWEGTRKVSSHNPNNFVIDPYTYKKTVYYAEKLTCKEVYDMVIKDPKHTKITYSITRAMASFVQAYGLQPRDSNGNLDYTKTRETLYACLSNPDFNELFYIALFPNGNFQLFTNSDTRILIEDFDSEKKPYFNKLSIIKDTNFYIEFIKDTKNQLLLDKLNKYIDFLAETLKNYNNDIEELLNDFPFQFNDSKYFNNPNESFSKAIGIWLYLNVAIDNDKRDLVEALKQRKLYELSYTNGEEKSYTSNINGFEKASSFNEDTIQNNNLDIMKIINDIKGRIFAQDDVIEGVVTNCLANQEIIKSNDSDFIAQQKTAILIDGPTGTGKTAICKAVSDKLGVPFHKTSIDSYSETGYKGRNLTQILVDLYNLANGDLELAQRSIVCLDEFDKIGANTNRDNSKNLGLQNELLTFIEGATYTIHPEGEERRGNAITFDTSYLTFIAMGAFADIREQKGQNKTIGFGASINTEFSYEVTARDYISAGIEEQLIGRFHLLLSTKSLKQEDLKNILLHSTISPLKTFIDFCKMKKKEVKYDDTFIEEVSLVAEQMGFGARGLHKLITDIKNKLLLTIMTSEEKKIKLNKELLNVSKHGKKEMGY